MALRLKTLKWSVKASGLKYSIAQFGVSLVLDPSDIRFHVQKTLNVTFFFLHNNNTLKNAHKMLDYELPTLYIAKALQLNHKIVIAYELKPPNHRRGTKDNLFSPELPFMPKH